MKQLKCLTVFLLMVFHSYAQQFQLAEDTIRINAADYINPISNLEMEWAAKYHGFYFCIFINKQIYNYGSFPRKNRLLVISENGKDILEVNLPKDFQDNYYGDLFVRHDTLFLRPYPYSNKQNGHYFDMDAWRWIPVEVVSNTIYDDDQYCVATIDMGEWGSYTWFMEKKVPYVDTRYVTSKTSSDIWDCSTSVTVKPAHHEITKTARQYIMPGKLSRIIKKDSVYYFIQGNKVDTLISLKGKAQLCETDHTYEAVVRNGHKYLYSLGSWGSADSLSTNPIPTLFHFTGRKDEDIPWWNEIHYDTVFSNAFLTNGNIYYLVNTTKNTYIAQLEDGKLLNKFDFGHQYHFFQRLDCFRGVNPAPNQCFNLFKETYNSYGLMEIKDTLIRICHIVHNQDTLPYIGTDNIEPLLQFLLNHLDNLTLSMADSVENALLATCRGEFQKLANNYFPQSTQTNEYGRMSYYTIVDSKQTLSVDYCVHQSDSVVRGVFFEWIITNNYNSNILSYGSTDNVKTKHQEVCHILTRLTGKEPIKSIGQSEFLTWTYRNITVELYENGRMVMYLTEE